MKKLKNYFGEIDNKFDILSTQLWSVLNCNCSLGDITYIRHGFFAPLEEQHFTFYATIINDLKSKI